MIESIVDFYAVKVFGIERKHFFIRQAARIEWSQPMFVIPSRSADVNFRAHRSDLTAILLRMVCLYVFGGLFTLSRQRQIDVGGTRRAA